MSSVAKTLVRRPLEGKIFGVCAGLSDYFSVDVTVMRIIFVVLVFATGGAMIILYLVLAIVMPVANEPIKSKPASVGADVGEKIQKLGQELQSSQGVSRVRNYFGISLLVFGIWMLLVEFFPDRLNLNWGYMWPIILIIAGLFVISRRK